MRVAAVLLVVVFATAPLLAQEPFPIASSIDRAAAAAAAAEQQTPATHSTGHRAGLFWSGLALGIAGATTSVLGLTALRVDDSSSGNAPKNTYQACVAQKSDPIYAGNQCDALKGKNLKLLWSGVAVAGVGAALVIGSINAQAEVEPGSVRLVKRFRF
jgi:hypothetical protein